MFNGNAESEAFYCVNVGGIVQYFPDDEVHSADGSLVAENVEIIEVAVCVAAVCPSETIKVDGVADAEIFKRAEEFAVDRFGQADFGGNLTVKISQDRLTVHALWGCSEAKENLRFKIGKK